MIESFGRFLWITPNPAFITCLSSRRCYSPKPLIELINELHEKDIDYQDRLLKKVKRENALDVFEHVHAYFLVKTDILYIPALLESYLKVSPLTTNYYLVSGNLRAFYNYQNYSDLWLTCSVLKLMFHNWLKYNMPYLFKPEDEDFKIKRPEGNFLKNLELDNHVIKIWETDFDEIQEITRNYIPDYKYPEIIKEKHSATMIGIEDVSRALTSQLLRHRETSPDQESQRFSSAHTEKTIIPPSIQNHPNKSIQDEFINFTEKEIKNFFTKLREEYGIPKEDARYIMPIGLGTKLVMTCTKRAYKHIIEMREDPRAQWEIRNLATSIKEKL